MNMTIGTSNEMTANPTPGTIAHDGFCTLLLPVLAIVGFPAAGPGGVIGTNVVDGQPQTITFVSAKAAVSRHLTTLFTGMLFYGSVGPSHAFLRAILLVHGWLATYLAGFLGQDSIGETVALLGAESLVGRWYTALFTRMRLCAQGLAGTLLGTVFDIARHLSALYAWVSLVLALGYMVALCRAVFIIERHLSALRAGFSNCLEKVGSPTFFGAVIFLGPHEEFAAIKAVGRLAFGKPLTFLRAVFLDLWRQPRATGHAITFGDLVGFLALVRAELVTVLGEGRPAVQARFSLFRCFRHVNAPCGICP